MAYLHIPNPQHLHYTNISVMGVIQTKTNDKMVKTHNVETIFALTKYTNIYHCSNVFLESQQCLYGFIPPLE
jgi:hypothetical protein